ncbi:MAG: hypothetical protein OEQ14_05530 [Gammaproteobacteria bacterium]|nr:hypothetical protein [Gammaproteobacteria bacterium]
MIERTRPPRVHLPRRSYARVVTDPAGDTETGSPLVRTMADRIESLPGIRCAPGAEADLGVSPSYYLDGAFALQPPEDEPILFAVLDAAGRVSLDVSPENHFEILRSGWGETAGDRIVTLAPRDLMDLSVLWRIILMAYFDIAGRRNLHVWRESRLGSRLPKIGETGAAGLAPGAFF